MKVILNGRRMTDKEATHEYLKEQFHFPEYYGCNLDALYDCLTEMEELTEIEMEYRDEMQACLGDYAVMLMETIQDAVSENPNLQLTETE